MRLADILPAYVPPLVRDREGLMREVRASWDELDGVVRGLSDADFRRRVPGMGEGADTWTVKDVVAHLAAWRRNAERVAALQSRRPSRRLNAFPGAVLGLRTGEFNAALLERWQDRSIDEVLMEHRQSFRALMSAVEALPVDRLLSRKRTVLWLTPVIGHPRSHLPDIRAALAPSAS